MRTDGLQLSVRHRAWLYGAFAVLFLSGVAWMVLHWGLPHDGVHPGEPWALRLHGAAALLTLVMLGTLVPLHIKRGWQARRNRGHGLVIMTVNLVLMVTGYALYYAGDEQWRFMSRWMHIVIGLLLPVVIVWHVLAGRATRPRHLHARRVRHLTE